MKTYTLYQIDSFTTTPFMGNPAGVITNADGLSDIDMQNIARELNNSETAFFLSPSNNDYDGELRYFTPAVEVPTCGHATIAAIYAKALENQWDNCTLHIKTKVGILPMQVIRSEDDFTIAMTQGKIEISNPLEDPYRKEIMSVLGLTEDDMDKRCPVKIASTGHSKVMIGINSRAKLNTLEPDFIKLANLSKRIQCNGYFVFTFDTDKKNVLTEGRMFAPAIGINEDPVTGNANGPLGAYLVYHNLVKYDDSFYFNGYQGEKAGRPGIVTVNVKIKGGIPETVTILGKAVVFFKTEITV